MELALAVTFLLPLPFIQNWGYYFGSTLLVALVVFPMAYHFLAVNPDSSPVAGNADIE